MELNGALMERGWSVDAGALLFSIPILMLGSAVASAVLYLRSYQCINTYIHTYIHTSYLYVLAVAAS